MKALRPRNQKQGTCNQGNRFAHRSQSGNKRRDNVQRSTFNFQRSSYWQMAGECEDRAFKAKRCARLGARTASSAAAAFPLHVRWLDEQTLVPPRPVVPAVAGEGQASACPDSEAALPSARGAFVQTGTRNQKPVTYNLKPVTCNSQRGSALIIALWTIALLAMLVMSFALDAMLEGKINVYVRQRRQVDYLTQSGISIAEMLLLTYKNATPVSSSPTAAAAVGTATAAAPSAGEGAADAALSADAQAQRNASAWVLAEAVHLPIGADADTAWSTLQAGGARPDLRHGARQHGA